MSKLLSGRYGVVLSAQPGRCLLCIAAFLYTIAPLAVYPTEAQQQSVFEASVSRVRVDVIVTDSAGDFIDDLRPEDFLVFEDGKPQQVLSLQLIDLAAGTVADLTPSSGLREPPTEQAIAPDTSGGDTEVSNLSAVILLVDYQGLDWRGKERFASVWSEYLADTDRLTVPQAAYLIDQVGRLKELSPLTFDVERLRQAAITLRSTPNVRKAAHEKLVSGSADITITDAEERARSRATLKVLAQFCDALAARRGRTALIWVTSEVLMTEGGPSSAMAAARLEARSMDGTFNGSRGTSSTPFAFLPDLSVLDMQKDLHEAANSANVSIYTIDPIPQTEWRSIAFDVQVGTIAEADLLNSVEVQASLEGLRDSLRLASAETGGRSFIGWSELDRVLPEIDNHRARFYLLTYAPPPPYGDGEYHNLEVEVLRPGVTVRARQGYLDLGEEERRSRTIDAALTLPGTVRDLAVTAKAYRTWSTDGEPVVRLATSVEGLARDVGASESGPAVHTFELHAVAGNEAGEVVGETNLEVSALVDPASGELSESSRPPVFFHDWLLPPGELDLRVAVEERASGRLGATRLTVEVPERSGGWRVSDPMLLAGTVEERLMPVLNDAVSSGEMAALRVEVFDGQQPLLAGEIFSEEGNVHVAQLPAFALEEDETGVWRGALRFRGLSPGRYTLQIMVTDSPAGQHAVFRMPFEVTRPMKLTSTTPAATGVGSETSDRRSPEVRELLLYLGRVAEIYRDTALSFVANETVTEILHTYPGGPGGVRFHSAGRRQRRVLKFDYVYGRPEAEGTGTVLEGGFVDYRRPRGSDQEDMTPLEVIERYGLVYLVAQAHSWAHVFLESNQPQYEYEITDRETVLGRPALVVRFWPVPPFGEGMSYWYGTAWFDSESYQFLRVEAVEAEEYEQKAQFEEAMRAQSSGEGDFIFTTVTTVFLVERNGIRFPGEVRSERSRYHVQGEESERRYEEYPLFELTQTYDNYRFFSIRTEEEIRNVILGVKHD